MKKTTNKLTTTERQALEKQLSEWEQSRSRLVTKIEKKVRWQQLVFAKIKMDAKGRRNRETHR